MGLAYRRWKEGPCSKVIFPRDGQFELFDALASANKQLIARPGPHAQTHPDDQTSWQDFIRFNTSRVTR
jgi:hypothetical protein